MSTTTRIDKSVEVTAFRASNNKSSFGIGRDWGNLSHIVCFENDDMKLLRSTAPKSGSFRRTHHNAVAPTIFIVPGIWEGPSVWDSLISILKARYNLPVSATKLLSTGHTTPDAPRMIDDIAHIRSDLTSVVETAGPNGVIMLCHSAGGFLGTGAMEGLSEKAMNEKGKQGGLKRIIFLTAAVAPEGHVHDPMPFMKIENGAMTCTDLRGLFFNDLSDEEIAKWLPTVQPGPAVWNGQATTYCRWREVPSMYILCEKDQEIPAESQEQMAALAGSKPIVRIPAGHMAQLSMPERIAEIVGDVVGGKI